MRDKHTRFCSRIYTSSLIQHPTSGRILTPGRELFSGYNFGRHPPLDSEKAVSGRPHLPFTRLHPCMLTPLHPHHASSLASPSTFSSSFTFFPPLYLPPLHSPSPPPPTAAAAALPKDSSKAWRAPSTATLPAITWCGNASCLSRTAAATAWTATPYWSVCPSTPS